MTTDPKTALLKECYDVLESIEEDGWIIRGNKATSIPALLASMRPFLFEVVGYTEHTKVEYITFECLQCKTLIKPACENPESWDYETCPTCQKRYRIIWRQGNIGTCVLALDKEPTATGGFITSSQLSYNGDGPELIIPLPSEANILATRILAVVKRQEELSKQLTDPASMTSELISYIKATCEHQLKKEIEQP